MIKLIIFDLDYCICDPSTGYVQHAPFNDILQLIGKKMGEETKKSIQREIFKWGIEGIIQRYKISKEVAEFIRGRYEVPVIDKDIRPYDDVEILSELRVRKILVTTGLKKMQESKIERLGIKKYFDEMIINDMTHKKKLWTKKNIFKSVLKKYKLKPKEIMVVGDRPYDELQPAKELGMITIQSLRPKIVKTEGFDYYIGSFRELPTILKKV